MDNQADPGALRIGEVAQFQTFRQVPMSFVFSPVCQHLQLLGIFMHSVVIHFN